MSKSAGAIAAEIRRRLPNVGEVKLHKLLYYVQGHHLASFGESAFGETISAWDLGPVVGTLRHAEHNNPPVAAEDVLGEAILNTIGYVLSRYGGMTGNDLVRLSHSESPWKDADSGRTPGTSVKITADAIRTYFVSLRDEDEEAGPPIDRALLLEVLQGATERRARPAAPDSLAELKRRRAELAG